MADENRPFGNTIFCEDIRTEVEGKFSFIGCIMGILQLPSFPVTIPKFAFSITLYEPEEVARKRDFPVQVGIFLPGETEKATITGDLGVPDPKTLDTVLSRARPKDSDPWLLRGYMNFLASPLVITSTGVIRVRANYAGDIIKLGSMAVIGPDSPAA